MANYGPFEIDDYLTFACNTHATTGVATDADSAPSYRIYEDETTAAILTGSLAKLDDDNTTGFYTERIQLTAANGFERRKCYTIYIEATVGGNMGTCHHNFMIVDEPLTRLWSTLPSVAAEARCALNALRALRNKVSISGTTLTVTEEDDSTTAWTATVGTGDVNPITSVDPT